MDVFFELQRGRPFSIEVGYFDTVLEIKEKIEKYHGIPVSKQTLIFNGKVIQDDRDVEQCEILHNSRIQLLVSSDQAADNAATAHVNNSNNDNNICSNHHKPHRAVKTEQSSPPPNSSTRLSTDGNLPCTSRLQETDSNDTVLHPKEMKPPLPVQVDRAVDQSNGGECETVNKSCEITNERSAANSNSNSSKRLRLMVLPKYGTKKIPVEVSAGDNVGELRKELARLHQQLNFSLPREGYFFIYKQNVMDDDRSFRWHHVGQGDTIEIFSGSVSGGS